MLKDHLEQLVKVWYLKEFVVDPRNQEVGQGARPCRNPLPPTPIGSNSSHPRGPKGLSGVQEEGGASCGVGGK